MRLWDCKVHVKAFDKRSLLQQVAHVQLAGLLESCRVCSKEKTRTKTMLRYSEFELPGYFLSSESFSVFDASLLSVLCYSLIFLSSSLCF